MKFYGKTDIGMQRYENQDRFGIYAIHPGVTLLVVCDGMGGARGGARAAETAIEAFSDGVRERLTPDFSDQPLDLSPQNLRRALAHSARDANSAVLREADEKFDGSLDGMGTTLVAMLIVDGKDAFCLNIGDSRAYEIKNGTIRQISRDHSYVQHLIDIGKLSAEEAKNSPIKNVITRAIGSDEDICADIISVDATPSAEGELHSYLLCSDGLSGMLDDTVICNIVSEALPIEARVEKLVREANEAGGADNVTIIIVDL